MAKYYKNVYILEIVITHIVPTSADIVGRILSAIGAQPACNSVDVNSITNEHSLFAHFNNSTKAR